jgi:hypothetical protein
MTGNIYSSFFLLSMRNFLGDRIISFSFLFFCFAFFFLGLAKSYDSYRLASSSSKLNSYTCCLLTINELFFLPLSVSHKFTLILCIIALINKISIM